MYLTWKVPKIKLDHVSTRSDTIYEHVSFFDKSTNNNNNILCDITFTAADVVDVTKVMHSCPDGLSSVLINCCVF